MISKKNWMSFRENGILKDILMSLQDLAMKVNVCFKFLFVQNEFKCFRCASGGGLNFSKS